MVTGTPARVLIADDDVQTRNLLRELLEGWGHEPLVAADGEQALSLLPREPHLALLDLMMPKVDGFEVLRRVRASPATSALPVILLTAAGEVDDKIKAIELGADDYVTKPFRIADLQRRIEAALDKRRALLDRSAAGDEAQTDPLTGVGTYPQLKEALGYEVERARRYRRPLTALLVAVDDSPMIFEALGREATNDLLSELAGALRRCFRVADRIFRIDVEAFVVLLPETPSEGALVAAERFAQGLREQPLTAKARSGPRAATASVGLADFPRFGTGKADDLVRAAHRALQRAQRAGTAQVALAVDGELEG